jgi:hypothetical protein
MKRHGVTQSAAILGAGILLTLVAGTIVIPRDANALSKSECEALGGSVENANNAKICGSKGYCRVNTKDSSYVSCVTELKRPPVLPPKFILEKIPNLKLQTK